MKHDFLGSYKVEKKEETKQPKNKKTSEHKDNRKHYSFITIVLCCVSVRTQTTGQMCW